MCKGFNLNRRDLLRLLAAAPAAAIAAPAGSTVSGMKFERFEAVRLGFIGLGGRGTALLREFTAQPGVRVTALCDVVPEKLEAAQSSLARQGSSPARLYSAGERAYEEMVRREDIDLVVIATPWLWHTPMALASMKAGKHAAVEVPAARTIEECWNLVRTSEKARRHCIMLENCCYGETELLVLNMVRAGLLGELTHAACGYNHDLRSVLFSKEGEGLWRRAENQERNGNLYPTHGLGPVANYMDINRGDRFENLVSLSSASLSLQAYRRDTLPAEDPRNSESYRNGDHNVSLIRTARGRLITVEHNVATPQPYDRINLVAGTKGIFRDYPPRIYAGGPREEFGSIEPYREKFEHSYWKRAGTQARSGGHGGMDFVMAYRLIECMRAGTAPDMDVYDAAAWSAVAPLSERSVAKRGESVSFPDFTNGAWQQRAGRTMLD